jgi:hypothetical protein
MTRTAPTIRVGEPRRHGALSVFPLFGESERGADYRLASEALADGSLRVEEVGEAGLVGELAVHNRGDVAVLFLEGEELVGAKQDRVVNTTTLVGPHARLRIPVSCVEAGRWAYRSHRLLESGVHSPSMVRHALKSSVSLSLGEGLRPIANQAEIWDSVARLHAGHDVASRTGAMAETFERRAAEVARYRAALRYVPGARGVAVAVEERVVAIDVFDRPDTCEQVWDRLLSGAVLDALLAPTDAATASPVAVETMLETMWDALWEPVETLGEGREFRVTLGPAHASTLTWRGVVVHESLVLG